MRKFLLGVAGLTLPLASYAVAVPVTTTAVTEQLGEINTAVAAIGAAMLVAAAIAVAFKWAKAAIFG